jgi:hypothetical protein
MNIYRRVSGQQINMDKSSIHFAKGVSNSSREAITIGKTVTSDGLAVGSQLDGTNPSEIFNFRRLRTKPSEVSLLPTAWQNRRKLAWQRQLTAVC